MPNGFIWYRIYSNNHILYKFSTLLSHFFLICYVIDLNSYTPPPLYIIFFIDKIFFYTALVCRKSILMTIFVVTFFPPKQGSDRIDSFWFILIRQIESKIKKKRGESKSFFFLIRDSLRRIILFLILINFYSLSKWTHRIDSFWFAIQFDFIHFDSVWLWFVANNDSLANQKSNRIKNLR